jgi:hypothetical protein
MKRVPAAIGGPRRGRLLHVRQIHDRGDVKEDPRRNPGLKLSSSGCWDRSDFSVSEFGGRGIRT